MDFEIELRPHVGTRMDGDVEIVVEQDQYMIFVSGPGLQAARGKPSEHIGYVGKKPGMPINYLKVAAAFGESTVKIFSQMIRSALLAKARQRIEEAKQSAAEAHRLREESEGLLLEYQQLNAESAEIREAVRISDDAIAAANQELLEAGELTTAEQDVDRKVNEPTEFYGAAESDSSGSSATGQQTPGDDDSQSADSQANSQNL